ncbi:hypothetical protein DPMN_181545 [Dreissena polymorpha]|uniref:Uncharacterized protein n=1 Tax=Dreissena polymorpha TaxID=45954 RepID=A0A9D4DDR2_DREPO|nr:hypothetical protein DPMN_181545 [Dreissena polymorpha]
MAPPISKKVYIFGHSFLKKLKDFIRNDPSLCATVDRLRNNLEDILDFNPDIVVLVVGTKDIYNRNQSPLSVASAIRDIVDTILFVHGIPQVIVLQTLHRHVPTCHTRYPVDIDWFNYRVDEINSLLID